MFKEYILLILAVLILNSGDVGARYKLPVTVYYESLCGDSRRFIVEQLQPSVQMLYSYLKLKLVPFGKARSIDDGYGGFVCQHGPAECLGNLVQDCVLDLMANHSDVDKVNYVACEMTTKAGTVGNLQCAEQLGIPVNQIKRCVTSERGIMLQLDSEHQTSLVEPRFIPTVTFGGMFNQQIQNSSQVDLFGTLCSLLKELPPCAQHYNNLALHNVLYGAVPDRGYWP